MATIFLWNRAIFVFDANVLLHVYEFSQDESEELVDLIKQLKQLWIPPQFIIEYNNNKEKVRSRNLLESPEAVYRDRLANEIEHLFEENDGDSYPDLYLNGISEIWEWRIEQKIPPGLNDRKKPEPERYGDLIGWLQIIDFADKKKLPVVMVTDDQDWFEKEDKSYRAHPDLLREMHEKAGVEFHLFTCEQFVNSGRIYVIYQDLIAVAVEHVRHFESISMPDFGRSVKMWNISVDKSYKSILETVAKISALDSIIQDVKSSRAVINAVSSRMVSLQDILIRTSAVSIIIQPDFGQQTMHNVVKALTSSVNDMIARGLIAKHCQEENRRIFDAITMPLLELRQRQIDVMTKPFHDYQQRIADSIRENWI